MTIMLDEPYMSANISHNLEFGGCRGWHKVIRVDIADEGRVVRKRPSVVRRWGVSLRPASWSLGVPAHDRRLVSPKEGAAKRGKDGNRTLVDTSEHIHAAIDTAFGTKVRG